MTYKDKHAELVAFTYFKENYEQCKEINLDFAKGNKTFKTSINAHAEFGDHFFSDTLNNLIEEDDTFQSRSDLSDVPKTNLTYFNYADNNLNCMTAAVDQVSLLFCLDPKNFNPHFKLGKLWFVLCLRCNCSY